MRYSSRKLSNDKVITTACNFWRQIACSFQVMSGNILFLGKKSFEIPPFFQTRPEDLGKKVHACSIRFSALKGAGDQWTYCAIMFSREYSGLKCCFFEESSLSRRSLVKCRVKLPCENLVNIRFLSSYFVNTHLLTHLDSNMGKLNVSMLRYLSSEEFRVLTAVSCH